MDYIPKWKSGPRSVLQPLNKCVKFKYIEPVHEKLIKPSFAPIAEFECILEVKSSADNPLVYVNTAISLAASKHNGFCGATPKMYKSTCLHSPYALAISTLNNYSWNRNTRF